MIQQVELKFGEIGSSCPLHISVPGQTDTIWCSDAVGSPIDDLNRMMNGISYGRPAAIAIDEEGELTIVRFDVEPGAFVGRLRVYEMPYNFEVDGAIKRLLVDAQVDKIQLLVAYRTAYLDLIPRYTRWDGRFTYRVGYGVAADGYEYPLGPSDLYHVETALMDVGALALSVEYLKCLDWKSAQRERTIKRYRNAVPKPVVAARSIWEDIFACRETAGSEIDLSDATGP